MSYVCVCVCGPSFLLVSLYIYFKLIGNAYLHKHCVFLTSAFLFLLGPLLGKLISFYRPPLEVRACVFEIKNQ